MQPFIILTLDKIWSCDIRKKKSECHCYRNLSKYHLTDQNRYGNGTQKNQNNGLFRQILLRLLHPMKRKMKFYPIGFGGKGSVMPRSTSGARWNLSLKCIHFNLLLDGTLVLILIQNQFPQNLCQSCYHCGFEFSLTLSSVPMFGKPVLAYILSYLFFIINWRGGHYPF